MVILYYFYSAPFLANNLNKVRDQVPVVQRVDSAMHWMMQIILIAVIHCVVIYPVNSVIHPLNNRFCSISLLIAFDEGERFLIGFFGLSIGRAV